MSKVQIQLHPGTVQYTLCIIAEELVFRVWLQAYAGVWLTALLFVLLHGYFFTAKYPWWYMLLLVAVSVLMGYGYQYYGLGASLSVHLLFNSFAFQFIKKIIQT